MLCRLCSHPAQKSFTSGNLHGRHVVNSSHYQLYYCPNCQSYSLEHVENTKNYFQTAYDTHYYPANSTIVKILNKIGFYFQYQTVRHSLPFTKRKIDILDVGCGEGNFLNSLPKDKYNLFGSEINPQGIKSTKQKNIQIFAGDFNHIDFGNSKFDCITLWHVLEHLPKPQQTIAKIFKLLKPHGVIIIATPCCQSLGFKLGQKYYFHLDSPRHLFIPSPQALKTLLQTAGFTKYHFANPFYDYPLDLFWSVRKSPFKYLIYPLYPFFKLFSRETILVSARK